MIRAKPNELVDTFDEDYKLIGTCGLAEVHRRGLWHSVAHLWLIDSLTSALVYQRRGRRKSAYPRHFDISVAGHERHGETHAETLQREAMEEIGINVNTQKLLSLGVRRHAATTPTGSNCEFQNVFLTVMPVDPAALVFHDGEVDGVCLLEPHLAARVLSGAADLRTHYWESGVRREIKLTRDDFVPTADGYNARIAALAVQVLAGDQTVKL